MQSNSSLPTILAITLTLMAVVASLCWFGWTVLVWSRWHVQMPWRDVFVILDELTPLLQKGGGWAEWLALLEPHYAAHRIAVPRILVLLDVEFFGGRNRLLYAAGWLGLALTFGVFARLSRDFLREERILWVFVCAITGILLFAPAHLWNIANAINTSWHVSIAFAVLAFLVLVRGDGPPTTAAWLLAYTFAALSSLATFTGVIAWLLLPVAALAGRRRTLVVTALASVVLAWLYTRGISSDAEIAAGWDVGSPDAASQVRETAKAAIEANNPLRMAERAFLLLCWPLSGFLPLAAGLLFALSLFPLGVGWLRFLGSARPAAEPLHPWQKLCLLVATLCLGVALAVQLGRLIEQPNYAHGPSYERYNTLVALYWIGVCGLLASVLLRLERWRRVGVMAAMLAAVQALLAPTGAYLQQEIESLQTAARLYAAGETPALRDEIDRKLLRFKPEYVYHFDALFRSRELAYARAPLLQPDAGRARPCSPGVPGLSSIAVARADLAGIRATVEGRYHYLVRDILLTRGGSLYARLYPVQEGGYSPADLLRPSATAWEGAVAAGRTLPGDLGVTLNMVGGASVTCVMTVVGRSDNPATATGRGGVAGNV